MARTAPRARSCCTSRLRKTSSSWEMSRVRIFGQQHAGKLGGRSVWLGWRAPANGIATFNTRGSSFDTLLAVSTGTGFTNLVPVFADDDRGGFATSQASFNASAGTEYLIALDGFGGQAGNILLTWTLDSAAPPFPRILIKPLSVSVSAGQPAVFAVYA